MKTILKKSAPKRGYRINYELVEDNGRYGIECYIPGQVGKQYCYYHDISDRLETAIKIFELIYKGRISPINIAEMIEDFYTY